MNITYFLDKLINYTTIFAQKLKELVSIDSTGDRQLFIITP